MPHPLTKAHRAAGYAFWEPTVIDFILWLEEAPQDAASKAIAELNPIDYAMVSEIDTSSGLHILEFHGGSMVGTVIILIVIVGLLYFLRSCLVNVCRKGMGFARRPCPPLSLYG